LVGAKLSEKMMKQRHDGINTSDLKVYSGQYYQYKNVMEKLAVIHIIRNEIKDFAEQQEIDLVNDKAPKRK